VSEKQPQRLSNTLRAVQDVLGQEPDGDVAADGGSEIPSTVSPLRALITMEGNTVALDHEPSVNDEVHPSNPSEFRLEHEGSPQRSQHQSDERFRSGLGSRIEQIPKLPVPLRQPTEDLGDLTLRNKSLMPRAVECRNREPSGLASTSLDECLNHSADEIAARGG